MIEQPILSANELAAQEQLVSEHAGLVKRIAFHLLGRLPSHVDVDDLIQAGMLGLLMAGKSYVNDKGANFETYAGIRIRGAMLDEVRKSDWTPRSVHRKAREIASVIGQLETTHGTKVSDTAICEALGITLEEYRKTVRDQQACKILSLDAPLQGEDDAPSVTSGAEQQPHTAAEEAAKRSLLAEELKTLPEREQLLMSLYYEDELNLREIGEVLGVSESRACQIHGQALARLRTRLFEPN